MHTWQFSISSNGHTHTIHVHICAEICSRVFRAGQFEVAQHIWEMRKKKKKSVAEWINLKTELMKRHKYPRTMGKEWTITMHSRINFIDKTLGSNKHSDMDIQGKRGNAECVLFLDLGMNTHMHTHTTHVLRLQPPQHSILSNTSNLWWPLSVGEREKYTLIFSCSTSFKWYTVAMIKMFI